MMNKTRRYGVHHYGHLRDIFQKLHDSDWAICTGMRWADLLFLHDGGGEYAVVIDHEGKLTQIESFTVRWMSEESFEKAALRAREKFLAGEPEFRSPVTNKIEYGNAHTTCDGCR